MLRHCRRASQQIEYCAEFGIKAAMSEHPVNLAGKIASVRLERNEQGVAHITADSLDDAHLGLGFCHARDRGLQMLLVRVLGRGRACEQLQDSEEMLVFDRFFRRWN